MLRSSSLCLPWLRGSCPPLVSLLLNRSSFFLAGNLGEGYSRFAAVMRIHQGQTLPTTGRMEAVSSASSQAPRMNMGILSRSAIWNLAFAGNFGRRYISTSQHGHGSCRRRFVPTSGFSSWHLVSHGGLYKSLEDRRTFTGSRRVCASTVSGEVLVSVPISVEESTVVDEDIKAIVEQLEEDGPKAVNLAIEDLEEAEGAKTIELSVVLCSDPYIQELNKEWRGKDSATDVLSFPQPAGPSPIWLLGDIVISLDTAARQAKERDHTLLEEIRVLLVHGLLHVLGYDHELGPQEAQDMEDEEKRILSSLGWKGDGLISASLQPSVDEDCVHDNSAQTNTSDKDDEATVAGKASVRRRALPFKLLFCDMDGTLLNSQSKVTKRTADAVREAIAAGVQVVIATGKARPAAIAALDVVGLAYNGGAISLVSPGVFLQGLLVYGQGGSLVHKKLLTSDICTEAFRFSLDHGTPLVGFAGDQCVTLREHPNIDLLHSVYYEPKAEVMPSVEHIVANSPIQKLVFCDTKASVSSLLRPYWSAATRGRATVVQAVPEMLEILPLGTSKGGGVQYLLEHLGVHKEEVMAIGDGENDKEMLELVGFGVAMANGAPPTLAVADALVGSNDEDGVAEAIERFLLA